MEKPSWNNPEEWQINNPVYFCEHGGLLGNEGEEDVRTRVK